MLKTLTGVMVLGLSVAIVADASGGVLGQRYISAGVGQVSPGDDLVKEVDDSLLSYGAGVRWPLATNLDLVISFGQTQLKGDMTGYDYRYDDYVTMKADGRGTSVAGQLQYQFLPGAKVNPFISGGVIWGKSRLRWGPFIEEDDDTGFLIGGGAEISMSADVSVNTGLHYQSEMFEIDDIIFNLTVNVWATKRLLLSCGAAYGFDTEDMALSVGAGVSF